MKNPLVSLFDEEQTKALVDLANTGATLVIARRDTALLLDVPASVGNRATYCAPEEVEETVKRLRGDGREGVVVIYA